MRFKITNLCRGAVVFFALLASTLKSPSISPPSRNWKSPEISGSHRRGSAPLLPFRHRLMEFPRPGPELGPIDSAIVAPDAVAKPHGEKSKPNGAGGGRTPSLTRRDGIGPDRHEDIQTAWVRRYENSVLPSRDNANAAASDAADNVYVTGYSEATYTSGDYVTVKFSPLGDTIWSRRYNGSGNGVDEATAIAVDNDGNVLVTGYSFNANNNADYVTVKYSGTGDLLWERTFSGPDDSTDVATAIGVDTSGNVYVTGYSYSRTTDYDYCTVAYSPDGTEKWAARFDGEGHATDIPTSIAVSRDGRVSLTGFSDGGATGFDIATICYSPAGVESWHAVYSGSPDGDDRGSAIAWDGSGNVFLCGSAFTDADHNFQTLKYSGDGTLLWEAQYDGPGGGDDRATALALDSNDGVVVTGFSAGGTGYYAFATLSYDASGNELWRARHAGSAGTNAFPTTVAINAVSGIIVTGYVNDILTSYSIILTVRYDGAGTEIWSELYNGQPHSYDIGVAILFDRNGNTYVAGTSVGAANSEDYVVVRYDAPRYPLWPVRYDATGNPSEKLTAMFVDKYGNVYITGFGYLASVSGYGVVTVKFDPDGNRLWSATIESTAVNLHTPVIFVDDEQSVYVGALSYSGGVLQSGFVTTKYDANGLKKWTSRYNLVRQSEIKGIVVDSDRNVYIAGTNFYQRQMITIMYDADGQFQWSNLQNGSVGGIAIDSSDRVYVTGAVDGFASAANIVTMRFSATGGPLWSTTFNGPNNSIDGSSIVSVDGSSRVLVAGTVYSSEWGYQFVTLCYDSLGGERWVRIDADSGRSYSSPAGIVSSSPERICIAGKSPSMNDFETIMYDSSGVELWRRLYDGTGHGVDEPKSLAMLPTGDVVVGGTSPGSSGSTDFVILRYTRNGALLWSVRYNSPANGADDFQEVGLTDDGFTFGAGTSKGDYLILRVDSAGNFVGEPDDRWPATYGGTGLSNAFSVAAVADTAGTIAIGGSTAGTNSVYNFLLTQYSSDGTPLSPATYTGNGYGAIMKGIAVDRSGNKYVTGDILRELGSTDIATLKYSSTGQRLWLVKYNGLSDDYDFASAIAVDDTGNVYVAGSSIGRTSGFDFIVIKYAANGAQLWEARYNGTSNGDDLASAIALDNAGSVYVTGLSAGGGTKNDIATIKYSNGGVLQWVSRFNGNANDDDRPTALAVDNLHNAYTAGFTRASNGFYDYVTIKYDTGGTQQWVAQYDGPAGRDDLVRGIAVDAEFHVNVTGESDGGASGFDYATLQYDVAGQTLWTQRHDGGRSANDRARRIIVDGEGSCYVTGRSVGEDGTYDFETVKYTKSGVYEWGARYSSAPYVDDEPSGIALGAEGSIIVAGNSYGALWSTITTIRYTQGPLGIPNDPVAVPLTNRLFENFPNPFNPSTTIRYSVREMGEVTLRIFNILGEEIAVLAAGNRVPGEYSVSWNAQDWPSGVYYARLQVGSFIDVKKMLLIK